MPTKGQMSEVAGYGLRFQCPLSEDLERVRMEAQLAQTRNQLAILATVILFVTIVALEATTLALRVAHVAELTRVAGTIEAIQIGILIGFGLSIWWSWRSAKAAKNSLIELSGYYAGFDLPKLHLVDYAPLFMRSLEVFGESDRATSWMYEPNPSLGNHRPIDALTTEDGKKEVFNILGRIEHGVLS